MTAIPGRSEPHEFLIPALTDVLENALRYMQGDVDCIVFRSDGLLNNKNLAVYCVKELMRRTQSTFIKNKSTGQSIDLYKLIEHKNVLVWFPQHLT